MVELDGDETAANYTNTDTAVVVDYFHLNSITIAPEGSANAGNLLVSARHVNAIMMINRTDDSNADTNDIIWLVEDATSCQHYAQYSSESSTAVNDGNMYISVFNNNDDMTLRGEDWTVLDDSDTAEVTELVIFPIDSLTGEILTDSEDVERITVLETGTDIEHYSFSCGSLQYVMEEGRDIATIGWGNNSVGDTYLSEIFIYEDGTTEINFEISYPEGAIEYMSYRSVGANIDREESSEDEDGVTADDSDATTDDSDATTDDSDATADATTDDSNVPATGDTISISLWFAVMILMGGIALVVNKKEYKIF